MGTAPRKLRSLRQPPILVTTTVTETFATILKDQLSFLSKHFRLAAAASHDRHAETVTAREGISVYPVPMHRGISPFRDIVSIFRMVNTIRRHRPVLVHSYTPKAGLVTMVAAFLCRVPVRVHTFTGLIFPSQTGAKRIILKAIDRLICLLATTVVPEGEGVKAVLQEEGVTKKPLKVIGHGNIAGVNTIFFNPDDPRVKSLADDLRASLKISPSAFVFCFIGRLNRDKGIKELAEAFNRLKSEAFLIIGGEIDLSAPIDGQVYEKLRRNPNVYLLGHVSDVRPLIACSNIVILPSYREGFPNVLLEAGALAKPCIATNITGCNEIILHNQTGWLIRPRSVSELRRAMEGAMQSSHSQLISMGEAARRSIESRFERTAYWNQLLIFYQAQLKAAGYDVEPTYRKTDQSQ